MDTGTNNYPFRVRTVTSLAILHVQDTTIYKNKIVILDKTLYN